MKYDWQLTKLLQQLSGLLYWPTLHIHSCYSYGLSLHSIRAVCKTFAWSLFYRNLELPELDKIQIITELLCVKCGLVSLPLFDAAQIDFML